MSHLLVRCIGSYVPIVTPGPATLAVDQGSVARTLEGRGIVVSTGIDRVSEDVLAEGIAQGIILVGWVALWPPAARVIVDVVPHLFNRRRFAEFADIDVRFVWT